MFCTKCSEVLEYAKFIFFKERDNEGENSAESLRIQWLRGSHAYAHSRLRSK